MGGGGGGGGHTPYEAPESGRSKQAVRIVEIVSEGEVKGLVNGVQSVFLDNTPIQNKDGTYNFSNVEAEGRIGIQDQDILEGFNTSEKEISVGTQVRKNTPLTRTVSDSKVSRLRLTLGVQSLFSQNDQGDTHGTSVTMNITIGQRVIPLTINGKYSSQYLRQIEIDNLPPTPFTVRVERIDEDSKSQRLQNNTIWASYTEIIETRLAYPNTALVGIKFDSDYFSSIPNRTYDVYGIIVQVPSNYNPETRAYNGIWDGTFKTAWSDNPAWVLYDLLKNKRYGFGRRLGDFAVDKWALYNVAQYCDQLVDDGFGGKEPRFTCNAWITEQRQAYDVINDICSIFRAMPVWNGREFTVIQDRPADPVWTYTNANVDKEGFTYSYSAMKARHNEIHVEYANAQNNYEKEVICVSDDDLIRRYGLNVKKVTAFGCTSRGQAYRTGRWILETEKLETRTVTFTVGAEGLMHVPGDIILVADNDYTGTQLGGRVLSVANKVVTLDREVPFKAGEQFLYYNQDAQVTGIKVIDVLDGNRIVLDKEPTGLTEYGVWLRHGEKVQPQLYRALSIKEESKGKYTITALQHEPQKEAIVDSGAHFERMSFSEVPDRYRIQNVDVAATDDGIRLSFEYFAKNESTVKYQIKLYRTFDGNRTLYKVYDDLTNTNIAFTGLPDGDYTAEIRAKNGVGQLSEPVTKSFSVSFTIAELVTVSKLMGIDLNWRNPIFANTNAAIEIWVSQDDNFQHARKLVTLAYPTNSYSYTGLGAAETYYFWARMVSKDVAGKFTAAVMGVTERDATKIVDYIHGQISKSALTQELVGELTGTSQAANIAKNIAGNAVAKVLAEAQTRSTQINELKQVDERQAQAIRTVTVKADNALSDIVAEQKARADGDKANTEKITAVTARVGSAESTLTHLQSTKASKTEVAGIAQSALQSTWRADAKSAVDSASITLANADQALGQRIDSITSSLGDARAQISAVNQAVANANSALGQRIDTVSASLSNTDNLCFNPSMINDTSGWSGMRREFVDGLWSGLAYERDSLYSEPFPVRPGERFYVSMNSKNKDATYPIGIGLQMFRRDGSLFWPLACRREVNSSSTNWEKIDGYLTIPDNENIVSARLWIQIDKPWLVHHPGYWYVRNITFYRFTSLATERAIDDAKAQISAVSRAIAETNGKLSATHTIKTQVVAGGRTAIAGIALGASSDGRTAESSVIVMADKFGVVKDAGDGQVKPIFSIVNGSTALSGDLIADGTIVGRHIRANAELSAPNIKGGTITGNTINGTTVNGGTINGATVSGGVVKGSTIEGGVIKGAKLEAVTGKFSGTLEVNNLVGGNLCEVFVANVNISDIGSENNKVNFCTTTLHINPSPVKRIVFIVNSDVSFIVNANERKSYYYSKTSRSGYPPEIFGLGGGKPKICVTAYAVSDSRTIYQ